MIELISWSPSAVAWVKLAMSTAATSRSNTVLQKASNRLPMLAADVVGSNVPVIAVTGGDASRVAAMAATKTISIVFMTGGDPVQDSYVASLNRPGSNVTGVSWSERDIALAASWGSRGEGADRVRCSRPYPLDKNGMLR